MMNTGKLKHNVPILLVEDDEDDVRLIEKAFQKGKILNRLYVVHDGEEAMEFLQHTGGFTEEADAPRPAIILLDLNMPRMNGHQVLEKIKNDKDLQEIPVVILTTSDSQKDIRQSYEHGANTFITKPVEFDKFLEAVITLGKYWLNIAEVPFGDKVAKAGV